MDEPLSITKTPCFSEKSDSETHLFSLDKISKGFHTNGVTVQVLDAVDLKIESGETISIVGASGIGKSTLLHIMGTLDRPDAGKLHFQGVDLFKLDASGLAEFRNRCIGFVFQFHHLLPEFSAVENAMMPALISGRGRQEAKEAAESILVRVGLKDRLGHRVTQLSGGEQQRVALARALALRPKALLADEPTGNLDRKNSEQVHDLLMELNKELNMALVVVTHNTALSSRMSRHLTIINGNLTEAEG